jgi:glycosyltransferase involved in cell wall biosynthesis
MTGTIFNMKLSIVVPVLGQREMVNKMIGLLHENVTLPDTEILIIDQGKTLEGVRWCTNTSHGFKCSNIHSCENVGVYPTFKMGFELTTGDVVAFFHSDMFVVEKGFDERILTAFESHKDLGMVGFIGSNEIDGAGGRGSGTVSNFQGGSYGYDGELGHQWFGSPAEAHGRRETTGYIPAAVVDGCAMVIRRKAWEDIGYREDFPVHHFYDRLISTQLLEKHWKIFVLPIACDHISGQTVSKEDRYGDMAGEWCRAHITPDRWVGNPPNYAWDQTIYQEAERRWLREYRDIKHLVPIRV